MPVRSEFRRELALPPAGVMVQLCGGGGPPTTLDLRAGSSWRRREVRPELRPDRQ